MNAETIPQMKARFHKLVTFLRCFGFNGEVMLKPGLLIIGAHDKGSASMIRKAFKSARNAGSGTITEVRSKTGGAAFVWVCDSMVINRSEILELLEAA